MPGEAPGSLSRSDLPRGGLLGRAAEAAAIRRTLDQARLVTVTGLPGVGKTAVGLQAASAAAGSFADGAVRRRRDALRAEALLPHTIGAALRLPDRFTSSRLDVLVDQLRDRHLLLVLDTCEHLLGACAAVVASLLPPCPKVQVLATSREPLRVPGEAVVAVCPLPLRDAGALFGQRAAEAGGEIAPEGPPPLASPPPPPDKLPLAPARGPTRPSRSGWPCSPSGRSCCPNVRPAAHRRPAARGSCFRPRCGPTAARCCAGWARTRSSRPGISAGRTSAATAPRPGSD